MTESTPDSTLRNPDFMQRYARSRLRNAPVRIVFVLFAASIILAVDSFPLAFVCLLTVLVTEGMDCLANKLWTTGKLQKKYVLIITAILHASASSLAAIVTWVTGGEMLRFLVCMLYAGAMLNVGLTIFLFPQAAIARILIYMTTILGLFTRDAILIIKNQGAMSPEKFWADTMSGLLCLFVVFAFTHFINRYQVRKVENEGIIAEQNQALEEQVASREMQMEKLQKATIEAEQANSVKSAFLATMSHEIRTPMNGIIGIAELLNETDLDETQSVYVDTISQSGDALLSIINDILDFSKLEAQKTTLAVDDFDIHKALEDIATLLSSKRTSAKVELVTDIDPALPQRMRGDIGKFRQVLVNIIGNALKFTEHGHVLVRMMGVQEQEKENVYNVTIEVKDTGIGIPEDQIDHVFGAFSQVDSQATRKFQGTGLGLAITQKLVNLMGGTISVSSQIDKGTCFTINIPFTVSETMSTLRSPLPLDISGTNCLIVDDLELNRTILRRRLELWGARCQLCSGGNEAIDMVRSAPIPFGLIILDYQMPGINGADVYQQIRKLAPETPVILFSSVDNIHPSEVPGAEIMYKPMRKSLLEIGISRALGRKQAEKKKGANNSKKPEQQDGLPSGIKILIADDNKINQMVIRSMLKSQDIEMRFVETGKEALELYRYYNPDLVLMDISMPEMNGYDATKAIREVEQNNNLPPCPILALTANAMKEQIAQCLEAGMDGHIAKPVTKKILLSRINAILDKAPVMDADLDLSLTDNASI